MPSVLSREDLRSEIYKRGVTDPRKLGEVMRFIEVYALTLHKKLSGQELEDAEPVVFTPLKPGEWNATLEITCCVLCEKVKRWDQFHADGRHATGHKTTCMSCRNAPVQSAIGGIRRGGWVCKGGCEQRRTPEEFPPEKRENPRSAVKCLYCQ